jgi:hypothetical protein
MLAHAGGLGVLAEMVDEMAIKDSNSFVIFTCQVIGNNKRFLRTPKYLLFTTTTLESHPRAAAAGHHHSSHLDYYLHIKSQPSPWHRLLINLKLRKQSSLQAANNPKLE